MHSKGGVMSGIFRIVLADSHVLVRDALARVIDSEPDFRVVAQVDTGEAAIEQSMLLKPDLVLMDVDSPGLSSLDAARAIRHQLVGTRVVFMAGVVRDGHVQAALDTRVDGFVTKADQFDTVMAGLREVMHGASYFSRDVRHRIIEEKSTGVPRSRTAVLTKREMEILRYLATGMTKKEIAGTLRLSVKTVDNHSTNLMSKLDIHDRVTLARFAIREGLATA